MQLPPPPILQQSQQLPSSTRIVDLDRQHQHMPPGTRVERQDQQSTTYQHIDAHPNPYGHSTPNLSEMSPPIQARINTDPYQQQHNQRQQGGVGQVQGGSGQSPSVGQGFPPRDIPKMDPSQIIIDEQARPNYIPTEHQTIDQAYLQQYEKNTQREIDEYLDKHKRESKWTSIWESSQIPIMIGLLFFVFNMPIASMLIKKYMSVMDMHDVDGNFSISGLLIKSVVFGITYYLVQLLFNSI